MTGFDAVAAVLFHRFGEFRDFRSREGEGRAHARDVKSFGLVGGSDVPTSGVVRHPFAGGSKAATGPQTTEIHP